MADRCQLTLSEEELVGLFILMKKGEMLLDSIMSRFLHKLEKEIYRRLTVEEIERLLS